MSTEETFPNHDPLKLRGKRIGLHPNDKYKYTIESFSYPASFKIENNDESEDAEDYKMKIGYMVLYQVKFNFKYSGRKAVTCKVPSIDVEGTDLHREKFAKRVVDFIEGHAEEIIAKHMDDILLDWETKTDNDPKEDQGV